MMKLGNITDRYLCNKNFYFILFLDASLVALSFYAAYLIRFELFIPQNYFDTFIKILPYVLALKMLTFSLFNLYRGMWRYTSMIDIMNVVKATLTSSLIIIMWVVMTHGFHGHPRSVFIIDGFSTFLLIGGVRVIIRLFFSGNSDVPFFPLLRGRSQEKKLKRLLIIGAGDAGEKAFRELRDNPRLLYNIVGFIDDDPSKIGRSIHNKPVVDMLTGLNRSVETLAADELLIAIPSATGAQMRRIVDACKGCGVPYKTLPGLGELIEGKVSIKTLRDVDYQDLLGRPAVKLNVQEVDAFLAQKCILVTGAGGSIGSELCRQVINYDPSMLILQDTSENSLYSIQMELEHSARFLNSVTLLGRVQNHDLMDRLLRHYKPDIVLHAAAYKHVPMIEQNPWQAIHNNIRGTQALIEKCVDIGIQDFVLISTDKAVRPTNVMGATKRVCEMLMKANTHNGTCTSAVRFGNVVGSSGSVIPLFREQIARGGPLTVTHPDVTRYFMTIPEACQLILQAGALGRKGDIFILEMGTPVKIADMARDLITLSGKEPDRDIEIVYTGLRPGEKLYEELITEGEGIVPTEHEKIMVLKSNGFFPRVEDGGQKSEDAPVEHPGREPGSTGQGCQMSDVGSRKSEDRDREAFRKWLLEKLGELYELADQHDAGGIRAKLKEIVPEYTTQDTDCVL